MGADSVSTNRTNLMETFILRNVLRNGGGRE